jgi:nucleoside phosphorylase
MTLDVMNPPCLKLDDYTVGWVCALPKEMAAAKAMLDELHPSLETPSSDHNTYVLGRAASHYVVIACLPKGEIGTISAAAVAVRMSTSFKSIRFGLMVGIGGGVPSHKHDIRLGDIVVGTPANQSGGVVQYDIGKTGKNGHFERMASLDSPPTVLKTALSALEAEHEMEDSKIVEYLRELAVKYPKMSPKYTRQVSLDDVLFEPDYEHVGDYDTCSNCDREREVQRYPRDVSVVHYGLIASGNQVMKHGATRDQISKELGGVLCFEMEAAGLMNNFPCLVIRGICDYADSHKNKRWQEYAAAVAAAYTKELLGIIPVTRVAGTPTVSEVISKPSKSTF